jgi:hypothetical protein
VTQDDDRMIQALANLRSFTPDAEWERRVRLRCHAKIAGRRTSLGMRLADAVTLAALCAYFSVVLGQAARLAGLLGTAR